MKDTKEVISVLSNLAEECGRLTLEQAIKTFNRRRLQIRDGQRPKRKRFPWSKYEKLYRLQRGLCPLCRKPMVFLRGEVEVDHRNPNDADFNGDHNLQLTHKKCNRSKSSKSLYDYAKSKHVTISELLKRQSPSK